MRKSNGIFTDKTIFAFQSGAAWFFGTCLVALQIITENMAAQR